MIEGPWSRGPCHQIKREGVKTRGRSSPMIAYQYYKKLTFNQSASPNMSVKETLFRYLGGTC